MEGTRTWKEEEKGRHRSSGERNKKEHEGAWTRNNKRPKNIANTKRAGRVWTARHKEGQLVWKENEY